MVWRHRRSKAAEKKLPAFSQCPGCGYDIITGEGTRSCGWYDCPYLPEEYKVLCPECNYNFATKEGDPRCSDPPTCEWALEGNKNVDLLHRFLERQRGAGKN